MIMTNWAVNKRALDNYYRRRKEGANTRRIRYHSSDDMTGLGEFSGVTEPVAVVIRPDGSVDAYGYVAVIDQRAAGMADAAALNQIAMFLRGDTEDLSDEDLRQAVYDIVGQTGRITDGLAPDDDPGDMTDPVARAVQEQRDRLMPQACGECGGEVSEDGAEPDHFEWCPEYEVDGSMAKEDRRNAWQHGT